MPAETTASARDIRNVAWTTHDVHGQYSDGNPHADLYRFLHQWIDMGRYLNVGYSRPGQVHLHTHSHLRLIDRLAHGLLALHRAGPHREERRLLDVGSGRGGAAIRANRRHGLDVLGIDFTPHNLALAAENARRDGVPHRVRFRHGDAHALPVDDASFPLAWSIESPAHFHDKPQFLREVARALRPGGAFTFADLLAVEGVAVAHSQAYQDFLQVWDVPYLETQASYRAALAQAGFRLCRAEIVTRYNLDIYRRYCGLFLWLSAFPRLQSAYRRTLRRRTGARLDHVHHHVQTSHRALTLGMIDYGLFWAVRD